MDRDGSGVSALVGLDGFVVRGQLLEESTGEWWLAVETTEDRAWCEQCGGVRATGHGRRRVMVRDLPITDRPVVLVWAKRLWRCTEPVCAVNTWSEECDEIAPRAVLTERARAEICRRVGPGEQSVAQAARDFGVSWHAAMAAVRDHGQPRVDHLARLGAPGDRAGRDVVPDRHRRAPNPARDRDHGPRHGPPRRCSACSQRHRRDRLARREARPMADGDRPCGDRPLPALRHRRRRRAARRPPGGRPLPRRAFGQRRDEVRRRTQQTSLGHRGRRHDPLYRIRRRLLAGHERLGPTGFAQVLSHLDAGDPKAKSVPPTWPRNCCARATSPPTPSTPDADSSRSTTTATPATCPSSNGSPAPSPAGRSRSCAGTAPGSPTPPPRAPTSSAGPVRARDCRPRRPVVLSYHVNDLRAGGRGHYLPSMCAMSCRDEMTPLCAVGTRRIDHAW
jgi:transposase